MPHVIIPFPGNESLARGLAAASGGVIVPLEFRHFPDGEMYLRVTEAVEGRVAVVACGLEHPNERVLGLSLLTSTLRDLGATRVLLVSPYLPYMRQDRAFQTGEGVSAAHFARLLSTIIDELVTVDPHLHRIRRLDDIFSIPTHTVRAAPQIATWIAHNIADPVLIGPDVESEQWVARVAALVRCPFLVLEKQRCGDRDVEISISDPALLRGRSPVLIDDIISTGQTMIAATRQVAAFAGRNPVCVGVHAVFAGNAYEELLHAGAGRVVTCNTIPHFTNRIDLHHDMGKCVASAAAAT